MGAAGKRNRRIVIERAAVTLDDYGGETTTWAEHCRARAMVSFGTGQERREAAQESASVTATFRVLDSTKTRDVTPQDRLVLDGVAWDIVSNVPFERRDRDITAVRKA